MNFGKKKELRCEWQESCICDSRKSAHCDKCELYYFIDSGFGWCKALPVPTRVAWCRDICGLFRPKKKVTKKEPEKSNKEVCLTIPEVTTDLDSSSSEED